MRTLVADVMTADVAAVEPSTPARAIARLLDARKISAVPVVDRDCRVLGIVSEADVLRHRYTGGTAEQIMSVPAITIRQDQPAVVAARLMDKHRIKRLPVVDDYERLTGIVSRSDLVHVYAGGDDLRLTET